MSTEDGPAGMLGGMTDAPMTREQAEQSEIGQLELGTDCAVDHIATLVGIEPYDRPVIGGVYIPPHRRPDRPLTAADHAQRVLDVLNAHPVMQILGRVAHIWTDDGDGHEKRDERGHIVDPPRYIVIDGD